MQRNWDIVRKVLLEIERLPTEDSVFSSGDLADVDNESTAYHMRLLLEARLIVGGCRSTIGPPFCHASRLTWEGHEFLDSIKSAPLWTQVKAQARSKGVDLSFTVIKELAGALVSSVLM